MRKQVIDDNVSHERWLVSYADFITLLFAFFVVMYSISQVNEAKYRVLSDTLTETFNKVEGKNKPLSLNSIPMGDPSLAKNFSPIDLEAMALKNRQGEAEEEAEGKGGADEKGDLPDQFKKIADTIEEVFGELLNTKMIHLQGNEEWLAVELSSSLLFASGDARLSVAAMELLAEIAALVKGSTNPIRVEGFTDDIPISNEFFQSNWELSATRAAAVVRLFIDEGISPERLAAVGYGEYQPVTANSNEQARNKNRRVVLMISKTGKLRPDLPDLASSADFDEPFITPPAADIQPEADPLKGVQTIELEGGGLLFTNDPEEKKAINNQ